MSRLRRMALALALLSACSGDTSKKDPGDSKIPTQGEDTPIDAEGTTVVTEQSENIRQVTQSFDMKAPIAPTQRWTQRTNGLCGQKCRNGPRHMYSAAFEDTLLVSWMAVDPDDAWVQYGNVATFTVSAEGEFTLINNVSFDGMCEATYGIATNEDGSVISVLCRGKTGATTLLEGAQDLLGTRRQADCKEEWEGRCYPIGNYSEQDSALYIFEYRGGRVTATPDSMVRVNHAVGGWRYGHHELLLNAAEDTYFVHLKVTAGPSADNRHEGLTHFAVRRKPDFEYVKVTDEWACGAGHVTANRMAYNRKHDTWSKLCMVDSCATPSQYANGRCNAITFYTVPGVTRTPALKYEGAYVLELDQGENSWTMSGGVSTLLSLGADGWLALAAGQGDPNATTKPDTVGLLRIPVSIPELTQTAVMQRVPHFEGGMQVGEQEVERYPWNWLQLPEPLPELKRERRAGMAAMAYFDTRGEDSERLLVGWSPTIAVQGIAEEYVVSEIDRDGKLRGEAFRLKAAGWGEDNRWETMPSSGCVVFPFAWVGKAPGGDYPIEAEGRVAADFPTTLYMTSLCPGMSSQPPLESPAP